MLHIIDIYQIKMEGFFTHLHFFKRALSRRELEQSKRFFTPDLTNKYILTRGILRVILARYLGSTPEEIEFIKNVYGKPYIRGAKLEFNMSHSYDFVSYAFTSSNFNLGIDTEFFNRNRDILNIAKSVFSNNEWTFFLTLDKVKRQNFFFNAWSKKEAVIKAMGMGLAYPMDHVDTRLLQKDGYICLSGNKYFIRHISPNKNYKSYLAIQDVDNIIVSNKSFKM